MPCKAGPRRNRAAAYRMPPRGPGVDLELYADDVRSIFMAHFAPRVRGEGCDPDDVLQVVYVSILRRNKGKNPYDESRGAFGSWVYHVCRSVWSNYRIKVHKQRGRETLGAQRDVSQWNREELSDVL